MLSYQVSERRACKALLIERSVYRYQSTAESQAFLIKRIKEIASIRVRYGYRRIHILLKREGWKINHKRVYNLYRQQELQMRLKSPRRRVSFRPRQERVTATRKNECWSMDFVTDQLFSGQRIRILTIVDNFTRESINLSSGFHYKGVDVANALSEAIRVHGVPETIKVDNGPEFISKEVDLWAYAHQVCDRYVVKLGGESPLWTLVRRTIREGKGVHCEVESEESRIQNADLTNRKRIRGRDPRTRMHLNSKSHTYSEGSMYIRQVSRKV